MRPLLVAALGLWLAGCGGLFGGEPSVQRAVEGPSPVEIHDARFVRGYARTPNFEESEIFRQALEQRVTAYFARHPEVATSEKASHFRPRGRVIVGMSKEEVVTLLGDPDARSIESAAMQKVARQFWSAIQPRVQEMWTYPGGWSLYFDGEARVADIIVAGKAPI